MASTYKLTKEGELRAKLAGDKKSRVNGTLRKGRHVIRLDRLDQYPDRVLDTFLDDKGKGTYFYKEQSKVASTASAPAPTGKTLASGKTSK